LCSKSSFQSNNRELKFSVDRPCYLLEIIVPLQHTLHPTIGVHVQCSSASALYSFRDKREFQGIELAVLRPFSNQPIKLLKNLVCRANFDKLSGCICYNISSLPAQHPSRATITLHESEIVFQVLGLSLRNDF
jgi:hypothetical protein